MAVQNKNNFFKSPLTLISLIIGLGGIITGGIGMKNASDNEVKINQLMALNDAVSVLSTDSQALKTQVSTLVENGSLTEKDIENYLMDHPTVMLKSLTKFKMEQETLAGATGRPVATSEQSTAGQADISSHSDKLLNDPASPVIGNPEGKHVITVFADYNCGHCKRLEPAFEEWLEIDPEAKLIVKEFPIFTNLPTSMSAAVIGVALNKIDPTKYAQFHKLAMKAYPLSEQAVNDIMSKMGVSVDDIKANSDYAQKQIESTRTLAAQLGVNGTPTFFINGAVRSGGSNHTVESLMGFFN